MSAEPVEAVVDDLTHDAKGVIAIDGRRFFVAGALPGERVTVIPPGGRRRNKLELEALAIADPAPDRVEPACSVFGRCGGCALQHLAYDAQLEFKQNVVRQAFSRIASVEPQQWLPPAASRQWSYRRRARFGARFVQARERVLLGFRERASSFITDMQRCPVVVPPLDEALGELADILTAMRIRDRVPQVELATGDHCAAIIVRHLDALSAQDKQSLMAFGAKHDLDVYVQPGGPGSIEPLGAARALSYELPEFSVTLHFDPTDFIQVNADINAAIVHDAIAAAQPSPDERVLDLFCGIGNFSLPLARSGAAVLGVEGDAGLVARAADNARRNALLNARFVTADLARNGWAFLGEAWDVVVLDPPRSGAAALAEDWSAMRPRRIIYVSCHPATLARDAGVLVHQHGYTLAAVRIYDMFPHTHHVETMAIFDKS